MRADHTIDLHLRTLDAVEVLQGHLQHLRPAALEQTGGVAQFQAHADAAALDIDLAQAAGADRIEVEMGIGELTQAGFHRFAGDGAHGATPKG
ncbi:hypothetical protein D9M69_459440 [compost metagenome]